MNKIHCLVWNEFVHEKSDANVARLYPNGIHGAIAQALEEDERFEVRTATLDSPEQGLDEATLAWADVVLWWGHTAHNLVKDEYVERLHRAITQRGVGLIPLHSGHMSKIFMRLMGTSCDLKWREIGESERIWVVEPSHPIVAGVPETFVLPHEEMYGERFDIPAPDEIILLSWFQGGNVFRSGCTWKRGAGRIFYFRPGHESLPSYYQSEVRQILRNGAAWAARQPGIPSTPYGHQPQPLEKVFPNKEES
nr:ThuA domain-containing protein [bacterium]